MVKATDTVPACYQLPGRSRIADEKFNERKDMGLLSIIRGRLKRSGTQADTSVEVAHP